jgi:signal transduction histidine kinase
LHCQLNESKIKASMIFYFAKYTIWPNEKNIEIYNFGVLTSDTSIFIELQSLATHYKIKNKSVVINNVSESNIPDNIQLLFVGYDFNKKVPKIAEKLANKNILLVTDRCQDGLFSMINFYFDKVEKTIAFNLNRQNLDVVGFEYSNELLLQGGTLLDLKELYKTTSSKLESELTQLKSVQSQNEILTEQSGRLKEQLNSYKYQIDSLTSLVFSKEKNLLQVVGAISEKELLYLQKAKELETLQEHLSTLEDTIQARDQKVSYKNTEIQKLNDSISQKQRLNIEKDKELIVKDAQIKSRERNTLILLAIVMAFIFASYLGFRGYWTNRLLNVKLEKIVEERTSELENHKNHLEELVEDRTVEVKKLNNQLEESNKDLSYSNKILEQTNKELISQRSEIELLNNELIQKNEELFSINESLVQRTNELGDALTAITEARNQLIQSEKMASLGLLVAGIAHEINNPVNFISAGVQALQKIQTQLKQVLSSITEDSAPRKSEISSDNLVSKSERIFKNMLDGVDRINEIIQSLSNYSRNEGEAIREHNIVETIKGTLIILHNKYKGRIKITENYYAVPPVYCIPGKMSQLFMNLISNAIDAISESGEIVITVKNLPEQSQVMFSVKDNGMGIPKKMHKRIFDPFYTTKEVGKGTGLGLYITFGIVEQHGGTIEVISEPGNGAEFIVYLPN